MLLVAHKESLIFNWRLYFLPSIGTLIIGVQFLEDKEEYMDIK